MIDDAGTAASLTDMLTTICLRPEQRVILQKPPFPYFGGKSRVAHLVWERFGDVPNYVEPFFGSGAVLFHRPHEPRIETVNDKNCYLANFWRALQQDPDGVAAAADWPVNECDLRARHRWLLSQADFRAQMLADPNYYDVKIAGWWLWGICCWIGGGWCDERYYQSGEWQQLPHLGNAGMGVHRPSQRIPHLGDAGRGIHRPSQQRRDYLRVFADRLRQVRVCCGDWIRILGEAPTTKLGRTAVFLDPPYSAEANRDSGIYATEDLTVAHDVRKWAIANGDNPLLRIALCGYAGEHAMPDSWSVVAWKANGGYGSLGDAQGRENSHRERIWFSPHCLRPTTPTQYALFF